MTLGHLMVTRCRSDLVRATATVALTLSMVAPLQAHSPQTVNTVPNDSVPLYGNLGPHTRPITTSSPLAQAYFDQAKQLTFAYGHFEALPSFKEAQRHDPECAMCYWGEAWAEGPYLNSGMNEEEGVRAYTAIQRAMELRHTGTEVEQALIEAMAQRYAESPTEENRLPLDSAYAEAMRDVVRRFPNDLDAGSLLGEALMLLAPRRFWTEDGEPQHGTPEMMAVIESVLARDIKHPGACHHYIHLVEAGPHPEVAEACADFLGNAIPGASHINHMPSHIYMNIGRYGDAVTANQQAWHTDQRHAYGGPPGIYPTHNLHMMLFGAWLDGQSAVAIQAARDLGRLTDGSWFYTPVSLVRFGRWDEVLEITKAPWQAEPPDLEEDEVERFTRSTRWQEAMLAFSRGMAHLRLEAPDSAFWYAGMLSGATRTIPDTMSWGFRRHTQHDLLEMARSILEGEIHAAHRNYDQAIETLRAGAAVEDGLSYDEPEPWPIPVRQVLGAVLLEAGRPAEAQVEYLKQLDHHEENGWSLFGLAQSLEAQGKMEEAAAVWKRFEAAWPRADIWLRSSRF
jgi:tetratricopeptide (TPR) repeat protein